MMAYILETIQKNTQASIQANTPKNIMVVIKETMRNHILDNTQVSILKNILVRM